MTDIHTDTWGNVHALGRVCPPSDSSVKEGGPGLHSPRPACEVGWALPQWAWG